MNTSQAVVQRMRMGEGHPQDLAQVAQEKTREGATRRSSSIIVSAKESGRRGVVPATPLLPLFPPRQLARAGGPLQSDEATEGGRWSGSMRGAQTSLYNCQWGETSSPLPSCLVKGSVDPGPVD
ncbi:hypothetical protein Sjap_008127 [Stephania japonica]|uniref:Uncharacterized protein n=1 Tax=Stephania japonica TaxID=461633 RepID=A0AAP0JNX3_9MAGN